MFSRKRVWQSKPTSLIHKKSRQTFNINRVHWNVDIEINDNDKYVLTELTRNIQDTMNSINIGFDVCKNISEFALGIIKKCPSCDYGEVLIIQSSFENLADSLKCNYCNKLSFIHKCNDCKFDFYFNEGWFINELTTDQTQSCPIPEINTCKDCSLNIIFDNNTTLCR